MRVKNLCILGGTGFVGRHICSHLADRAVNVRVLTRDRDKHRDMWVIPNLQMITADCHDPEDLRRHFDGCDAVINLVAILNERRRGDFQRVHVELPRKVAQIARESGVSRLLHMSALGAAPDAPSQYLRSKGEGERAALEADGEHLGVTSFRPSVIFGPGDHFFSRFAKLLRLSPGIFPLPTPHAHFRPVYVNDVADAFIRSLEARHTFGRSYELCGPRTYSLKELVRYSAATSGHHRLIVGLPDWASRLQGRILQHLPGKLYTYDNYLSATIDNVCREDGLAALGIEFPVGIEASVPQYMADFAARRRYNIFRRSARR